MKKLLKTISYALLFTGSLLAISAAYSNVSCGIENNNKTPFPDGIADQAAATRWCPTACFTGQSGKNWDGNWQDSSSGAEIAILCSCIDAPIRCWQPNSLQP